MATDLNSKKSTWFNESRHRVKKQSDYLSKLYDFRENLYEENRKQLSKTIFNIQSMTTKVKPTDPDTHKTFRSYTNTKFFCNQPAIVHTKVDSRDFTAETIFNRVHPLSTKPPVNNNNNTGKRQHKVFVDSRHKPSFAIMNNYCYETQKGTTDVLPVILSENIEFAGKLQPTTVESVNRIKKVLNLNEIFHEKSSHDFSPTVTKKIDTYHNNSNKNIRYDEIESSIQNDMEYIRSKARSEPKLPVLAIYGQKAESTNCTPMPAPLTKHTIKTAFSSYNNKQFKTPKDVIDDCINYFSDETMNEFFRSTPIKDRYDKVDMESRQLNEKQSYYLRLQKNHDSFSSIYRSPAPSPDVFM